MYFFYYFPMGINAKLRRFPSMTFFYTTLCVVITLWVRYFGDFVPIDFYNLIYVPAEGGALKAVVAGFLHLGLFHLIGNVLYLVVFGRYVEDRMGPVLFTLLFLSSAGVANWLQGIFNTQVLADPNMGIIGASGAVSGLLGAFSVRFLTARVQIAYWVFMPLQAFTRAGRVEMPAMLAIVLWFVLQSARGLMQTEGAAANVAHVAHIAGFLWGVLVALVTGQFRGGLTETLRTRGEKYLQSGEPYAAQGAFIRYLTRRPDDAPVYASLARAMVMSGNPDGAVKNYRRACELSIDQLQRGDCENLYNEAMRGFSDFTLNPHHHLDLAFGLERNLKAELAVKAYESFERRYPIHPEAPFTLLRAGGLYLNTLSDTDKAETCYQKLVDKYPDDVWVDFALEQIRLLEKA